MPTEPLKSLPAGAKIIGVENPGSEVLTSLPKEAKILSIEGTGSLQNFNPFSADNSDNNERLISQLVDHQDISDDNKEVLRGMFRKKGLNNESIKLFDELKSAPNYYMKEGIPYPLQKGQIPPPDSHVASVWGSHEKAQDDNPFTDLLKHTFNIAPSIVSSVAGLAQTGYEGITDEDSPFLQNLKNKADQFKLETKEHAPLYDTSNIKKFSDLADTDRWNFSPDAIYGTFLDIGQSVGEFLLPAGAAAKGLKGAEWAYKTVDGAKKLNLAGQMTTAGMASYLVNQNEMRAEADRIGLTGRDKALFVVPTTAAIAGLDMKFGIGPKILNNLAFKQEKNALVKKIAKDVLEKTDGKLTQQAVDEMFKETVNQYPNLAATWAKETGVAAFQEGFQEGGQDFFNKTGQQLWDKLSSSEKKKFGTDALSAQSFGSYIANAAAGMFGGVPGGMALGRIKQINRENEKSRSALGVVEKGDESIKDFKINARNEFNAGNLSQEQYQDAITKVNAFKEYNDISSSLNLEPEKKREAFDKTFQKQNLESKMEAMGDPAKLHPLKLGEYRAIEKQSTELQKDINDIILESQLKKETTIPRKAVAEMEKEEQKAGKPKKEGEKKPSDLLKVFKEQFKDQIKEDNRKYEELPYNDFNNLFARKKHSVLSEHLKTQPGQTIFGNLGERVFRSKAHNKKGAIITDEKGNPQHNAVFEFELPEGKNIRVASSMIRADEWGRGHLEKLRPKSLMKKVGEYWMPDREKLTGAPVGMKVYDFKRDDGNVEQVIKIFSAKPDEDYGKFIGWAKATKRGKALNYSTDESNRIEEELESKVETPPAPPAASSETGPVEPPPRPSPEIIDFADRIADGEKMIDNADLRFYEENKEAIERRLKEVLGVNKPKPEPSIFNSPAEQKQDVSTTFVKDGSKQSTSKKSSADGKKSASGNDNATSGEVQEVSSPKAIRVRKGTKRSLQQIKSPKYLMALREEVFNPYDLVLQYFIRGGGVSRPALSKFFKEDQTEINSRITMWRKKGPTLDEIAHRVWDDHTELKFGAPDYKNAVEEVLRRFSHPAQMADEINSRYHKVDPREFSPEEQELDKQLEKIETAGEQNIVEQSIEKTEELSDQEVVDLSNKTQQEIDDWADYEYEEDPFGPFGRWVKREKFTGFSDQDAPFQKRSSKSTISQKIVEVIQKNFPKVEVIYDTNLEAAGQLKGDKILINPYYAGLDTPIHEAAHIIIGAIGYENPNIQSAIKQLKGTDLWKETKRLYPKLDEKHLGIEVLAEAIGREGAEIFKTEQEKSTFMKYLEYIFDWVKKNLGLSRNEVKSLARQIISGIGTKGLVYEGTPQNQIIGAVGAERAPEIKANLEVAKKMEDAGKSSKEIYLATGWERGVEGKWRYDLIENADDYKINEQHLSKMIDIFDGGDTAFASFGFLFPNTEVAKVYPEVNNIEVELAKTNEFKAQYDGRNNKIRINGEYAKQLWDQSKKGTAPSSGALGLDLLRSSIAHEMQHAIQLRESFVFGAATSGPSIERDVREARANLEQQKREVLRRPDSSGRSEELERIDASLLADDETLARRIYGMYAGEVEAENVEKRINMTPGARKFTPISETEELPRDKQIKRFGGDKASSVAFKSFRKSIDRDLSQERQALKEIKERLSDPDISKEEKRELLDLEDAIHEEISKDKKAYKNFLREEKRLNNIEKAKDLEKYSFDELIGNFHSAEDHDAKDAKLRLAIYLNQKGINRLQELVPDIATKANTKNFYWLEKWNKVLSNVSEYFPPLQELHKIYEQRHLAKVQEMNKTKAQHEKLAKAVVKERNGMLGSAADWFTSDSAKYFNYLDDNGKLRTNTSGLTKSQKDYLDFFTELVKDRAEILDEEGNVIDNTLIKIDKGFREAFRDKEYQLAFSALLPKFHENNIGWKGQLTSRFDKEYTGKSYSRDFYKAANHFIEDTAHVKYMKDLVPVLDGLELFYRNMSFDNKVNLDHLIGFIQEWKKAKLYRATGVTDPKIDIPLNILRRLTSATTMAWNIPANIMNVVIGNANAISKGEGFGVESFIKGNTRLLTKKGMALLKAYDVIKTDYDSNPKIHAMKAIEFLAFAGLRFGEIQIQGSQFLGKLDQKDFDSFEVKDGEIKLKEGVDRREFNQKMIKFRNEVSDVQGKYSEKDKSAATNYEFGKALFQFKQWLPAFWKDKFGGEFINADGEVKRGSFRYTKKALQELKQDWSDYGKLKGTWKNQQTMSNLKYLSIIAGLTALAWADDDDEDKRKKALSVDNALHQMMFVFDLQQLKYMVTSPLAAQGPVTKLIDATIALTDGDEKKFTKNAKKLIPHNKLIEAPETVSKIVD